jgi:hypothetical protein
MNHFMHLFTDRTGTDLMPWMRIMVVLGLLAVALLINQNAKTAKRFAHSLRASSFS